MANVKLSKEELRLVTDAEFILTKNRLIKKVYDLFGELSQEFMSLSSDLPAEVLINGAKISKGENYLGLPWVMLDYPRSFSGTDIFAVRCFFWWGNFFSITLLLKGSYAMYYSDAITSRLNADPGEWWISIADDPWQHHFDNNSYALYKDVYSTKDLPFIKLAKKIPLQQWDDSFNFFKNSFGDILQLLSTKPVK